MEEREQQELWWIGKRDDTMADRIHDYVEYLDHETASRFELYERNHKLYDLRRSYQTGELDREVSSQAVVEDNIVKQIVDTFVSMLGKGRPKAAFLTDGGDWSTQQKAKHFERYIEGVFHQHKIYKKFREILRDAMLYGTGVLRVDHDRKKLIVERVLIEALKVDEKACRSTPPIQMHYAKFISRHQARIKYGKIKGALEAINYAPDDGSLYAGWRQQENDEIMIIESWKLPVGDEKGIYCVSVRGKLLFEEEYKRDKFPFVCYNWSEPTLGFYGSSLVENIAGTQRRIHKMHRFIDAVQDRICVPRVYVNRADLGMKARFDTTIGQVIPVNGAAPVFETPKGISGEYFQRLDQLRELPLEQEGMSQMNVHGTLPGGIESGKAMRTFHDIQGDRHTDKRIGTEDWTRDVAEHCIEVTKDLYTTSKKKSDPEVIWKSRLAVKKIKWSEVDPKGDLMTIKIQSASIMSRTPAGRQQDVTELLQGGLIGPVEGRRLLDMPDLDQEMDLKNAMIEMAEHDIEKIRELKPGEDGPIPDELVDVQLFRERFMGAYVRDKVKPAPEHVLQAYRDYIAELDDMAEQAEQAALEQQLELQAAMMPSDAGVPQGETAPGGDLAPGLAEGL